MVQRKTQDANQVRRVTFHTGIQCVSEQATGHELVGTRSMQGCCL